MRLESETSQTKLEIFKEAKKSAQIPFWIGLAPLSLFSMFLLFVPLYHFLVNQTPPVFSVLAAFVGFQVLCLLSIAGLVRWYKRKVRVLRRVVFEGVKTRATVWRAPIEEDEYATVQRVQLRWHEGETIKEGHCKWVTKEPLIKTGAEVEILLDPEEGKVFLLAMKEYPVSVGEVYENAIMGSKNKDE